MRDDAKVIAGMLRVMNKVYWKLPIPWGQFMIGEVNDLIGLPGVFRFSEEMDEIIFERGKSA